MSIDSFTIPKGFEKVILVIAGMNLQAWYAGFKVAKVRRQIFNQEFMDKNFGDVHKREVGQPIQVGGYPDTGSGIYSQKLSYRYLATSLETGTDSTSNSVSTSTMWSNSAWRLQQS